MSEADPDKIRTIKRRVEDHSSTLKKIVDSLVVRFNRDLDDYVTQIKRQLDRADQLSDNELESIVMKLPVYMYFASSGVETLGVESESAKAIKVEVYNELYLGAEGTIPDKTKYAELNSFQEALVDVAFQHAYKKIKSQIEMASHIFTGARRVLAKRLSESEMAKFDAAQYARSSRRYKEDE